MHVVVDSNILIADPWLKSQRTRVLRDYVLKTRSRLVLLDPVWQEISAHTHRAIIKAVEDVGAALRNAVRLGVSDLPDVDVTAVAQRSYDTWVAEFRRRLNSRVADWVPLDPSVLPEVVHRAARSLAPVRADGRETRDTIIWLSLIQHLRNLTHPEACAFLSNNTSDFAAPDGVSLRPELRRDLDGIRGPFAYYATVDAFLKEHAEPIGHITKEWVTDRLDVGSVVASVTERLLAREPPLTSVRPVSGEFEEFYEPYAVERVVDVAPVLDDVYVYEVAPDLTEVFLDFAVDVTIEAECYMTTVRGFARSLDEDNRERYPFTRHLTCAGGLLVSIAAVVRGDQLDLGNVEEIGPL